MSVMGRRFAALMLVLGLLVGWAGVWPAASAASAAEGSDSLELILDASGSMAGQDPSGVTKIAAAKSALRGVIGTLPARSTVGIRVYGGRYADKARGCTDTHLVVPLGPLSKSSANAAIGGFAPLGYTPIAYSLKQAAKDLGSQGQRTIILVSDGEETCNADPCAVAKSLAEQGIGLHVDTVGFGVGSAARTQLSCIAAATGGRYYDAPNADSLSAQLSLLATRALRPYQPSGTPIRGTADPADAPRMVPGQYLDSLTVDATKHYSVHLADGVTPYLSATVIRPLLAATSTFEADTVVVGLTGPDGGDCGSHSEFYESRQTAAPETGSAMPGTIGQDDFGAGLGLNSGNGDTCGKPGTYGVTIKRTSTNKDDLSARPLEIVFVAEPPVREVASLPAAAAASDYGSANAPSPARNGRQTTGGGSFGDAPSLTAGASYRDSILAGETLFYRVKVGWGQSIAYGVSVGPLPVNGDLYLGGSTTTYNPVRTPIRGIGQGTTVVVQSGAQELSDATVPVRYRNRLMDQETVRPASLAGYYYIAVHLDASDKQGHAEIPLRIIASVRGSVAGAPTYEQVNDAQDPGSVTDQQSSSPAASAGSSRPATTADGDGGGGTMRTAAYVAGGGAALLLAAGLLLIPLLRRTSR